MFSQTCYLLFALTVKAMKNYLNDTRIRVSKSVSTRRPGYGADND